MDNKELLLSKKLFSTYKNRLEQEMINSSNKLKIPKKNLQEIINKNEEIIKLKKILNEFEKTLINSPKHDKE